MTVVHLLLPIPAFGQRGSTLQTTSVCSFARSFSLGAAFRSPALTILFRRPPRRDRCSRPTPSRSLRIASPSPFGPKLPSSAALRRWGRSMLLTRCLVLNPKPPSVRRFSLPFRIFTSFRIAALYRRLNSKKLALADSSIPFAPRQRSQLLLIVTAAGSTFRDRFRPPGSLLSEPLGTILIMLLKPIRVNG